MAQLMFLLYDSDGNITSMYGAADATDLLRPGSRCATR